MSNLRAVFLVLAGLLGWPAVAAADAGDVDRAALARLSEPALGLPPISERLADLPSPAMIGLGRKLFFDRRLSHNGTMSCGMCHVPEQGFTNNELARPIGTEGRSLRRSAPTVLNTAYEWLLFWDGRDASLETQVILPLLSREEMANPSIGHLIARIQLMEDYDGMFEAAYGGGPTIDRIGRAIAAWERTMIAADSPFDRWLYGRQRGAISESARRGFGLFMSRARCAFCHRVGEEWSLFTDHQFHNTGVAWLRQKAAGDLAGTVRVELAPGVFTQVPRAQIRTVGGAEPVDLGRYEVTEDPGDVRRFKTPNLRNIALTAPYMHDGSLATLEEVVRFYDRAGSDDPNLDRRMRPLNLSDQEVADLVAFLETLTSPNVDALIADARSVAVGN